MTPYLVLEAGYLLSQFGHTLRIFRITDPSHHQVFLHASFEVGIFSLGFPYLTFQFGLARLFGLEGLAKFVDLFPLSFELIDNHLVLKETKK